MDRTWIRLAALSLLTATTALATGAAADHEHRRGHHGPELGSFGMQHFGGDPERLVEHLGRFLDLSELQEQNISNAIAAARPGIEALRDSARANFDALHELDPEASAYSTSLNDLAAANGRLATEATLLHGRLRAAVHAELTPDQRQQLETEMRQRFERRAGRRRTPPTGQ